MAGLTNGRDRALAWDDLRLVLAIAEAGALSRAAAALGISHPTLSRRLTATEHRLDCRLVERSPQNCRLTAAGEDVCRLARRIADDVGALERRIVGRDGGERGLVRVTAPDAVSEYMLPGILAGLARELPAITVELIVSNEPLSLAQRAADLALRVTDDPDPALKGRRVGGIGFAVYRAGSLAAAPFDPKAPWVGFEAGLACSGPGQWLEQKVTASQIRFRANTLLGAAKAVQQGTGCGLLPCFIGESTPTLVRIGKPITELETGLWLLVHPEVAGLARIKAVSDQMVRALRVLRPVISGIAA